jgi:hypothetical protein
VSYRPKTSPISLPATSRVRCPCTATKDLEFSQKDSGLNDTGVGYRVHIMQRDSVSQTVANDKTELRQFSHATRLGCFTNLFVVGTPSVLRTYSALSIFETSTFRSRKHNFHAHLMNRYLSMFYPPELLRSPLPCGKTLYRGKWCCKIHPE